MVGVRPHDAWSLQPPSCPAGVRRFNDPSLGDRGFEALAEGVLGVEARAFVSCMVPVCLRLWGCGRRITGGGGGAEPCLTTQHLPGGGGLTLPPLGPGFHSGTKCNL